MISRGRGSSGHGSNGSGARRESIDFAAEVADVVRTFAGGPVRVTGEGTAAAEVRRQLSGLTVETGSPPAAIVEMSGDPEELAAATRAVKHGGLVVLAAEYGQPVELNVYADVHRRGLRVVGVPDSDGA